MLLRQHLRQAFVVPWSGCKGEKIWMPAACAARQSSSSSSGAIRSTIDEPVDPALFCRLL